MVTFFRLTCSVVLWGGRNTVSCRDQEGRRGSEDKNFPQFVVIHTVKGFSVVNDAEVDVFLEFSCIFYDPMDVGNLTKLKQGANWGIK